MDNPALGRRVIDVMDTDPEHFSMATWGSRTACGTVACLAGTAMLLSGYAFDGMNFFRPDGSITDREDLEAASLLGMSPAEVNGGAPGLGIWYDMASGPDRFRKLVEESEGKRSGR